MSKNSFAAPSVAVNYVPELAVGSVVYGRYRVLRCVGSGGMGAVYACTHLGLGDIPLALKILWRHLSKYPDFVERFRHEIVCSYKVCHPNVVRAYDFFEDRELFGFTMEYVDGTPLSTIIKPNMQIGEVLFYLSQIAGGLAAIHESGVIHRDLKPENILVAKSGKLKIADFGIARTGSPRPVEDRFGTFDYVSPEGLSGQRVDVVSDIYSFGVLAYKLLTGKSPWEGLTMSQQLGARERYIDPASIRPGVDCPPELAEFIATAMAFDRRARFQSATELCENLDRICENYLADSGADNSHFQRHRGSASCSRVRAGIITRFLEYLKEEERRAAHGERKE